MEISSTSQDGNNFYGENLHSAQSAGMKNKLLNALIERESTPTKVGPRITAIRAALGMEKAEFADSLEYDRSSLTKVEKGTMGLDIAVGEKISALYGIGLDYIYRGELSDLPQSLRAKVLTELSTPRNTA